MLIVECSVVITRPIEQVFLFVANFENEPQYNPSLLSMRKTSPGAIGLGTTWQEVVRLDWYIRLMMFAFAGTVMV